MQFEVESQRFHLVRRESSNKMNTVSRPDKFVANFDQLIEAVRFRCS